MKIRLEGAELFHSDGQKGRHDETNKMKVAFRNFVNALKIALWLHERSLLFCDLPAIDSNDLPAKTSSICVRGHIINAKLRQVLCKLPNCQHSKFLYFM
jgi:hypothetical protein